MSFIHDSDMPNSYFIVELQQWQQTIFRLIHQFIKRFCFTVKMPFGVLFLFYEYRHEKLSLSKKIVEFYV